MENELGGPWFTYREIGATRGDLPEGYHRFRLRRRLGTGRELFERAGAEILAYRMQKGVGIFGHASTPTAEPGTALTVRLGIGPIALVAPCRVVYVLDDENRRGFAYGTLPGHPEIGEELFAVEYDPTDDSVHGLITAFSRPASWYTRLGGPAARLMQRVMAGRYLATLPKRP
ncbi:Uncharacterized protein, UPF0548 family [Nocardia amikacinitolerans]|uniref:Uncharacterized protein, UPF0548 family n=1 Tax=Nocardia amikacinitolerans TaxID=756689 RepID=A0A285LZ60_9NOCA|nr:DUF1990 domain-containing protein [Nocardia amikacinitolerans]MCP2280262.1 Uncharacterized protein, UPF0548 family [Nocardia amikacinitolerans]MCP2299537.1 Uncharacterized protein, UPF0548 family [Nocardia amikacinitolerans]SNY88591.1 Uncharacterized protein, UPF0548 family [Nocardia amikacinitolerans]